MEQIPATYVPHFSATVTWVAFITGMILYVIGYFGGIRQNLAKMIVSGLIAALIYILARPIVNAFHIYLLNNLNLPEKLVGTVIPIIWIIFVLGIALSLYETFTVTAKEAHPFS